MDDNEQTATYPAGFASFDPPVTSDPIPASTPQIAEYTRIADASDMMALTGEDLEDFIFYGTGETNVAPALLDGQQCALQAPADSSAVYMLWGENANGVGRPVMVNTAEAWWSEPIAVSGGSFSVYGRNLTRGGGSAWLYIDSTWVESDTADPYKATFTLPTLSNGDHTFQVHNGYGKKYGWSRSLSVSIEDAITYTGTTRNVTAGSFSSLQTELGNAVSGDVVSVPAGTYTFTTDITIPNGVHLQGAGIGATNFVGTRSSTGMYMWDGRSGVSNAKVSGISWTYDVDAQGDSFIFRITSSRITIDSCEFVQTLSVPRWQSNGYLARVDGDGPTYVTNCTIRGYNFFKVSAPHVFMHGNTFRGTYYTKCAVQVSTEADISGNSCLHHNTSDLNSSDGWGQGRFVNSQGTSGGVARNLYLGGNTTTNFGTHPNAASIGEDNNTGEQFMFEALYVKWNGTPTNPTATTMEVSSGFSHGGQMATIVSGTGWGQSRFITDDTAGVLTLEKAWDIVPDGTSEVNIGLFVDQIAIYNNTLNGDEHAYDTGHPVTGGCGVNIYGGGSNVVIDKNVISDMFAPVRLFALVNTQTDDSTTQTEPQYFTLVKHNSGTNHRYAVWQHIYESSGSNGAPYNPKPAIMGAVYRDENYDNSTQGFNEMLDDGMSDIITLTIFDDVTSVNTTGTPSFTGGYNTVENNLNVT